ncbi:MAG: hypothetical protein LBQ70_04270 [Prevotellaceae bacterium]|jgi:hypothetical protein|nr:hypothetical protein [Prevotellaceae bacterium]
MKRIRLFIILVALLATSCGFKSRETPIAGTDYVTFTVEGSDKIGVKYPGKDGGIVAPARYYRIDAYAGLLWATEDEDELSERYYRIWNPKAISIEDMFSSARVIAGDNYRIAEKDNGNMFYISETSGGFTVGCTELFIAPFHGSNYVFGKDTWGSWRILEGDRRFPDEFLPNYNKIWLVSYEQGKDFIILKRRGSSWEGYSTLKKPLNYPRTDDEVQAFLPDPPVWSEAEGDVAIYEKEGPLPERSR